MFLAAHITDEFSEKNVALLTAGGTTELCSAKLEYLCMICVATGCYNERLDKSTTVAWKFAELYTNEYARRRLALLWSSRTEQLLLVAHSST